MKKTVRVLICDDHEIYRDCIKAFIREVGQPIEIVGEADDGLQAVERALDLNPDIVLMDLEMPRMDGLEATRRIKNAAKSIKVLFLSMYDDEEIVRRCVEAGASGYLMKGVTHKELADAIVAVADGSTAFARPTRKSA